ncbi:hypothetical protein [Bradyrhizobium sp.]|uniref:hypothetical protein n=1 Tax=Bradyrhizobium sp. TaxID=376 RepID=UPI002732C9A9|nr:hypothetical protein [Bradyrhizobium sp.]MDP3690600.1 hypothetical protein [Bradyrhizobium sp.]
MLFRTFAVDITLGRIEMTSSARRVSRTGLTFCILYTVVASALVVIGAFVADDTKSRVVLMQMPIALQGALLYAIGLGGFLRALSWPVAYVILGVPTLLALYAVGAFVERAFRGGDDVV